MNRTCAGDFGRLGLSVDNYRGGRNRSARTWTAGELILVAVTTTLAQSTAEFGSRSDKARVSTV